MLELDTVHSGYGQARILRGVSFDVQAGEIHCLIGRNGAGKTTTMKTIMGSLRAFDGDIRLDGCSIAALPAHDVPKRGIGYIPQGRRLFGELTVWQNLEIGLMTRNTSRSRLDEVLALFPRLKERLEQRAQTLSGGEQQMLATARALCLDPKLLLLDEPTEGLQPSMIAAIHEVVVSMRDKGVAILFIEQRIDAILKLADRVTFMENGLVGETLASSEISQNKTILTRYLGVS